MVVAGKGDQSKVVVAVGVVVETINEQLEDRVAAPVCGARASQGVATACPRLEPLVTMSLCGAQDGRRVRGMTLPRVLLVIAVIGCGSTARDAGPTGPPGAGPAATRAGEAAVPRAFRVEVSGSGPPVILIPGLASSGETWATTVARLRGRYACHVLTLAGFAGVPPIEGKLLSAVETELTSYIESHRMVKPVIVGHSLGGTLAMMLATDRPELVGPLVIVDALPFFGTALSATTAEEAKPTIERIRTAMAAQTQDEHEAVVRTGRMTNSMATAAADQQRLISWGLASDRATVRDTWLEMLGMDLRPALAQVRSPALVIGTWIGWQAGAGRQRADLVLQFRDQYAALRRLHFAMSDTARHFVMFDDPGWFAGELERFLANPEAAVRDRGFPAL